MASARVLLVEDEGLVRMMTAEALRDEGFEVVEAPSGDAAAALLAGPDAFDILLTDVQMPGMLDGIDVAMQARLQDPAIPVLVVSGYAVKLMDRLTTLRPPVVFITKPYSLREIVDAILRATARR